MPKPGKMWVTRYGSGGRSNPRLGFQKRYYRLVKLAGVTLAPVRELTEEECRELEARLLGRK